MLKIRNEIIHAVKKHHKKLIDLKRVLKNIGQIPNTNLSSFTTSSIVSITR